jgi:hypothetical protein
MNAADAEDALADLVLDDPWLMERLRAMGKITRELCDDAQDRVWQRIKAGLDAKGGGRCGEADAGEQQGKPVVRRQPGLHRAGG